jgi:heme/copper-type cytochrome/quinol oxidase subunit 2
MARPIHYRFWLVRLWPLPLLAALLAGPQAPPLLSAQERAPGRRDVSLVAKGYRWSPDRIDAAQDDLIRLTIRSEDNAYGFAIDEYRIARRVPAGETTSFEFRAERSGTFRFYSNLTNDRAHAGMVGTLVVQSR